MVKVLALRPFLLHKKKKKFRSVFQYAIPDMHLNPVFSKPRYFTNISIFTLFFLELGGI